MKAIKRKLFFLFLRSHLPPALRSMGDFYSQCVSFHRLNTLHTKLLGGRGVIICTFKKKSFEIGEPAELKIGHIGDAIVTQMQNFQAAHQWLQTTTLTIFP